MNPKIDPDDALKAIDTFLDKIDDLLPLDYTNSEGKEEITQLEINIRGFLRSTFIDDDKKIQDLKDDRELYLRRIPHSKDPEIMKQIKYETDLKIIEYHLRVYKAELELINSLRIKGDEPTSSKINRLGNNRKIFIVHGHDDNLKNKVELFLKSLELEPIILHKQANLGKTIIEKVEHYSDVGFAVILLTQDDIGCSLGSPEIIAIEEKGGLFSKKEKVIHGGRVWGKQRYRARQNVIFEFGYFIAKLGRNKVALLCEGDIERPSDTDGFLYTLLDHQGEWKKKMAQEIDAAGIKIDEKFL